MVNVEADLVLPGIPWDGGDQRSCPLLERGRNRTGVEPAAPGYAVAHDDAGVRPYTTVPFFSARPGGAVRLTASAGRALSTLRHFPNLHEGVAPGLHPFDDGIPMVGWDLPDRPV